VCERTKGERSAVALCEKDKGGGDVRSATKRDDVESLQTGLASDSGRGHEA
jgi:hypothetical protein